MSTAAAPGARRVQIETPEHVRIGYELADLGSRFLAFVLDLLLFGLALFALGLVLPFVLSRFEVSRTLLTWGIAVLLIGFMLGLWLYFSLFEGLAGGRTPGKRLVGLRVIHDGGYPLTFRGSVVRNLIRLIDLQPLGTWMVGGAAMLMTPRTQRLGDLAAGTLVVRDRAKSTLPERAALSGSAAGPPVLTYRQFEVLSSYVSRRTELRPEARARVAASLAASLADHLEERAPVPAARPPGGWRGGEDLRNDGRLVALLEAERPRWHARGEGPASRSAQAVALVRTQSQRWHDYELLLERAKRGLRRLPEEDLPRFAGMYREVAADLARARTYHGSIELQESLERLVGAGHNLLYRPLGRSWEALRAWVSGGFPALVRRLLPVVALAGLLLFGPMFATYAHVRTDPDVARTYLPVEMISRAENAADRAASGRGYVDVPSGLMPMFSTLLISNNVRVTFLAFAGGILAGLGTAAVLILNGMHIGAVFGLYAHHEASALVWGFVAPHGVLELTAIVVSGAAGLWLGSALLAPGRRTRGEALRRRGREAVGLLAGTTLLLILAGLVEGFLSPAPLPPAVKFGFAALFALTMFAYLTASGRTAEDRELARGIPERSAPSPGAPPA
ncbi:MAG TPA: stage II sporulation protein M [Longimicrobiales bacterium]|nr:stage II sporulation protein M [Longimicrobiales bacterium]